MGRREEYIDKLAAQLKEWSVKIDELEEKADKAFAETKIELGKQIESLNQKRQAAVQKLQQLKESSAAAWESIAEGAEKAWNDLKEALHSASDKFK
jgi:uncharacterized coiled-coil DUF342 family protein